MPFQANWFHELYFQRNEYIFTVLDENSDTLQLGLRYSQSKLHFLFWSRDLLNGWQTQITFRDVFLADNQWHTLVLAVSQGSFSLTVDCSIPIDVYVKHVQFRGNLTLTTTPELGLQGVCTPQLGVHLVHVDFSTFIFSPK